MLDLIGITHSPHMLIFKTSTIISNDSSRDTELTYDMSLKERYNLRIYHRDQ